MTGLLTTADAPFSETSIWARIAELDAADPAWRDGVRRARAEREKAEMDEIASAARRAAERRAGARPVHDGASDERAAGLVSELRGGVFLGAWVFGQRGTGKTRLADAAVRLWVADGSTAAIVGDADLYEELRATFDGHGDWGDVSARYRGVGLLVLDDLGKARCRDWYGSALYAIVDWRWSHMLPTVVTSQFQPTQWMSAAVAAGTPAETAEAIVSRLRHRSRFVRCEGKDRRMG